jgi:hypothetical protein
LTKKKAQNNTTDGIGEKGKLQIWRDDDDNNEDDNNDDDDDENDDDGCT